MCNIGQIKYKLRIKKKKSFSTKESRMVVPKKHLVSIRPKTIHKTKAKIGYRFMSVRHGLFPITNNRNNLWNEKIAVADIAPSNSNASGLYIFRSIKEAVSQDCVRDELVLCKVKYWGICVEHKSGVRAEFAQILEIYTKRYDCFVRGCYEKGILLKDLLHTYAPQLVDVKIKQFVPLPH